MKILLLIFIIVFGLQSNSNAEITWLESSVNTNTKDYIRSEWKQFLGFDIWFYYYKSEELQDYIETEFKHYIGLETFKWDISLKIKKDNLFLKIENEF